MANINEVLTDREIEVLRLAAGGKKDWQVAESLKVSTSTITTYWYRIKMKLSVRSRSEAIASFATSQLAPSQMWQEAGDTISARASSRQWSDLGAPFVSFVLDLNGRFKQGAGSVLRYVGIDGKPPSDDDWSRFINRAIGMEGMKELKETGRYKSCFTIDEKSFEVYALVSNSHTANGTSVSATVIDVTPHVRLLKELNEERDYFKTVLDDAPNLYFIWDFELGNLTYVNHFAHHVLGYTADKLRSLGWSVFDLIHPDDREAAMARISQISHMRKGDILGMPIRVKTLEGAYISLKTVSTPFSVNEDGSVREFLCACFDIASYHAQLDQLEADYKRLQGNYDSMRTAVDHAVVGLMTIDMEANVLNINREGLRLLGADRDGWIDVYDFANPSASSGRSYLKLPSDWLCEEVFALRPLDLRVIEAHDYLGVLRKFMMSFTPVRECQGEIAKYAITFYSFEGILANFDYVQSLVEQQLSKPSATSRPQ